MTSTQTEERKTTWAKKTGSTVNHRVRLKTEHLTWCGIDRSGSSWIEFKAENFSGRKCKNCLAISEWRRESEDDEWLSDMYDTYEPDQSFQLFDAGVKLLGATMDGDEDKAKRLIGTMTHIERVKLQAAMLQIDDWIDEVEEAEREPDREAKQ